MQLSWSEIEKRAVKFSKDWKDASDEKAQAQLFLNDFFHVFGVDLKRVGLFEKKVPMGENRDGYIDFLWKGVILIEMKSRGKSLTRAFKQASDYAFNLTDEELPEYMMVCDFENIHLYRLSTKQEWKFKTANLRNHIKKFALLAGYKSLREDYNPNIPVNQEAAKKMAKLHDKLRENGYEGHELEVYLIRLLYCMFADDSGIFERGAFYRYIMESKEDGTDLSGRLSELFEILDMNNEKRNKNKLLPEKMRRQFPYINGKLFSETLPHAYFDSKMRDLILECCNRDWLKISPEIFGSMFQEVTDQKKRRELGAHYTSKENILKLIKPLFLDDLRVEFEQIKYDKRKLKAFHDKLAGLKFLDPACGCGNFLMVAYRELRLLELDVLAMLIDDSDQISYAVQKYCRVNVDQFYGIEIEDFPCQVARVGMWLTDHLMNRQVADHFGLDYARLPLRASPTIVNENALQIDWNDIVPKEELNYIMGNPPFVGAKQQSFQQKNDMKKIFLDFSSYKKLDYVASWYKKAAEYMMGTKIESAFVSTNSISQGEQPILLWKSLMSQYASEINFAYKTFRWSNEAKGKKAGVHCVIIGFSDYKNNKEKKLFIPNRNNYKEIKLVDSIKNIDPYLNSGNSILVTKRKFPLCSEIPEMIKGCQLFDNNNYIFKTEREYLKFIEKEPLAQSVIRPYYNAKAFLNNINMWCLYLENCSPNILRKLKLVTKRVQLVKNYRESSSSNIVNLQKDVPSHYYISKIPKKTVLVFPIVSSEKRKYLPIAFSKADCVYTNALNYIETDSLYHFGVLTSSVHMAWMRATCGRLEMRYRYSKDIVYNNFIWPNPTPAQKEKIEKCAQAVLDARKLYPDSTLADLYDPSTMPPELLKAHQNLDRAVKVAYGNKGFETEEEIVASLMKLYKEAIDAEKNAKTKIS